MTSIALTNKQHKRLYSKGHVYKGDSTARVIWGLSHGCVRSPILDVGAGGGALVRLCRDLGFIAEGVDLNEKLPYVKHMDASRLEYPDERFKTIFCTDVIEHMPEPKMLRVFRQIYRVLAFGGYAIFTTINDENLEEAKTTCPFCGERYHRSGHCQSIQWRELHMQMAFCGLSLVKKRTLNLGLIASLGVPAKLFYGLGLNKLCKGKLFNQDLFVIVQKVRNGSN